MKKGISDRMVESSELNQTKLKLGSTRSIKYNEIPPDSTGMVMHRQNSSVTEENKSESEKRSKSRKKSKLSKRSQSMRRS